jgi:hypothetical protein
VGTHFRDAVISTVNQLPNLNDIASVCQKLSQESRYCQGVCIAVDAVSCSDPFVGTKGAKKSADSSLFLVHLQPLEPIIQCQPLFVIPGKNGNASPAIQTLIDQALTVVKDNHISVITMFSGGDHGYNRRHQEFYD